MVVWWSAEGELTDIQRLDIWSPPPNHGLSKPLSHVLCFVCVCVCMHKIKKEEVDKNNICVFLYVLSVR